MSIILGEVLFCRKKTYDANRFLTFLEEIYNYKQNSFLIGVVMVLQVDL